MFKTVLFPVDQSREARQAAEIVANIVTTYGGRLVILSVVEPAPDEAGGAGSAMTSPEAIAKMLASAKAHFASHGIEVEAIEREGKPAFVICDVADDINADLIVMGSRGLGLTEEGVADSVSNRVINLSPCPVLIVP